MFSLIMFEFALIKTKKKQRCSRDNTLVGRRKIYIIYADADII